MTVHPNPRNLVRQMLPKRQPRTKRPAKALVDSVIAEIRRAETTVAQGARVLGCDPDSLGRRVWKETKRDVFARDLGCALCGAVNRLDAQHRRARKSGGTSDPAISFGMDNLITLCRECHDHAEQNPDWARGLGLRLDNGEVPAETKVFRRGRWVLLSDDGRVEPIGGEQ
ncbi:HNH endonuclease [Nocardia abscessus]|uniref:HNH endonuclease n=1 Tax=Nocardia abscessus TaxID=120957 RepID=UPI0002EB3E7A|nr:HNH endonuclease [Nocardia abscessus]MCC3333544.1 HNH endonuclease [Nocardia abscessus]